MGKKSTPRMPQLPNPTHMINAQAKANRVDTHNVMGGNTFDQNADGTWTQRQEYSPLAKALLARQMGHLFSAPATFNTARPQAIDQMYANTAAQVGAPGSLPLPQAQGGEPQANIAELLAQSFPTPKQTHSRPAMTGGYPPHYRVMRP